MAQNKPTIRLRSIVAIGILILLLTGCGLIEGDDTSEPPPTIASIDVLPTTIFLTENAPPPGFNTFDAAPIDTNLHNRQGWAYTITGRFEGTFDDDGSPAMGEFTAQVQASEIGLARRVVLDVQGAAMLPDDTHLSLEAVRFSNDYYLVDVNGNCSTGESGAAVADLNAMQLIGGVQQATPTGHQADIQGQHAWQYGFQLAGVLFPPTTLKLDADSAVGIEATLWVIPDLNAVGLYEITFLVSSVRLLSSERDVSGTLYLRYDLDIDQFDVPPNISIPHGC